MPPLINLVLDPMHLLLLPAEDSDILAGPHVKLLRHIVRSHIWYQYLCGRIDKEEAARQLQLMFGTNCNNIPLLIDTLNDRMMRMAPCTARLLDALRDELQLKLFCVCNASTETFQCFPPELLFKFHGTFFSCEEGIGKPARRFFELAMAKARIRAHETLYVDSDIESVVAARSLGMGGVWVAKNHDHPHTAPYMSKPDLADAAHLHEKFMQRSSLCEIRQYSVSEIVQSIVQAVEDHFKPPPPPAAVVKRPAGQADHHELHTSLASARTFLYDSGGLYPDNLTITSDGNRISDNFSQFIMADLLDDPVFLPMQGPPESGLIGFLNTNMMPKNSTSLMMQGDGILSQYGKYILDGTEDLDTTSMGLSVLDKFGKVDNATLHRVLDRMLHCVSQDDDGIMYTYFDPERPRIDPVAVANTLFLFHLGGRGHEVENSERFVRNVLLHRAYVDGTLYYCAPEAFLYFVSRLVSRFREHFVATGMASILAERLKGFADGSASVKPPSALAIAMRMLACSLVLNAQEDPDMFQCEKVSCGLINGSVDRALKLDNIAFYEQQQLLLKQQKENGSWNADPFYRLGRDAHIWFANEALTTAFAYIALQSYGSISTN